MKRTICGIFFVLLLASMFTGAFSVQSAQTNGSSRGEAVHPRSDWWPMFHHDPNRTGYSNTTAGPTTGNLLWNYTTGSNVDCSPAVVGGLVYAGSYDGNVYCLSAATGSLVWRYTTGDRVESSPAVVGGLVYAGSNDGNVYCLNATNGALVWSCYMGEDVYSSPAVVGGFVYVGFYHGPLCCLNAATGALVWLSSWEEFQTTHNICFTSAAVVGGFVYIGCMSLADGFCCFDAATGALVWCTAEEGVGWGGVGDFGSSAAVVGGFVYVGFINGYVCCINAATGALVWSYNTTASYSSPAVVGGLVYVGSGSSDGNVYCLNATNGALVWSYKTGGCWWGSPAVVNGVVYIGSSDHNIYALGGLNVSTDWNPSRDSYSQINFISAWAGGNCYGLSSTAILYFMNYILDNATCPYLPAQNPPPNWTSNLNLPANHAELNNASLAVMYHQVWDPSNTFDPNSKFPPPSENAEFYDKLVWTLEKGVPALLMMHGFLQGKDIYHAIVAYGLETLPDGTVKIKVSDPNVPQQEEIANYYPPTQTFSYSAAGLSFDMFVVVTPQVINTSFAPEPWAGWFGTYWWWHSWLDFSVTGYSIVIADKSVTIKSNGLIDKFTEMGNSQTFVKAIPGSSGIEEGNVQVYAILEGTLFSVSDPASDKSTIAITRVENESGQLFGYGYLVNATGMQGQLNYDVTPSTSSLAISSGASALNISATIFYATSQNHSIFQASNIQLGSMQMANFTVNNWQRLNDTSSSPVTLTLSPVIPEFPPILILPLFIIITLLGASVFKRKRNVMT